MKTNLSLTMAAIIVICSPFPSAAVQIGDCTNGIRTSSNDASLNITGALFDSPIGFVCGASQHAFARTSGPSGAVGVGAASVGASAGAGALAPEDGENVIANAGASVELGFMLKTVTPGDPFGILQVSYEVLLTTLDFNAEASGGSTTGGGGVARVHFFELTDPFSRTQAGGVPVAHQNGIAAPLVPGAVASLSATTVLIKPDTPYSIMFSVDTFAQASAGPGTGGGSGSAAAEFSAAVSLASLVPTPFSESDRYEIVFAIVDDPMLGLPGAGVFPAIDPPLSLVPLPPAAWLLITALAALPALGWRSAG